MSYLLDANVFIAAKNLHYGFDFCPAFWDWLIVSNEAERVYSVEKVGDELKAINDKLSEWAAERGNRFFLKADPSIFPALSKVSDWASGQAYVRACGGQHLPSGRRLLYRRSSSCRKSHRCYPRSTVGHRPQDQDPGRLHRPGD